MKVIYILLGFLTLVLGIIGILLPILPTTPFLLLTGFFFTKSSDRLNDWFINTKIYNKHIKDFAENRTMTKNKKWTLLIAVDVIMIFYFFLVSYVLLKVIIILLELIKYYYFTYHIKTV